MSWGTVVVGFLVSFLGFWMHRWIKRKDQKDDAHAAALLEMGKAWARVDERTKNLACLKGTTPGNSSSETSGSFPCDKIGEGTLS